MPKQIIIAEQHRIAAVFSEDQIQELIVATGTHQVGDIYLGVVENVLPGIDAAFVNIGDSERNGFIHVSDLGPLRLRRMAGSITELLAPQQKVLVQIMKEPTGNKGPRLTGNISLPGRYLVLMPFGRGVNLSRRVRNENERNRLRALAILVKPAGMGLLVRTEAEGVAEEAIIEDLELLQRQWENVQQEAMSTRPPNLLNRDDDFIQKVLRDVYSADVNRIVVDSHTGLKRVKQHLTNWSGGKSPQGVLIDHHRDRIPVLEYFRVNAAIREALKPRVDLPSGGYIIIERTEALTVIDVNSGSFTRSATARETVLWTNCEAATEIARQLRLRNIAGVIVVDFIDMDARRDQLQVLEHFNKALRSDKARPQIAQLTELGLVELTRKRQGQNIYELFGRPCATCGGIGHLVHLPGESDRPALEPAEAARIPAPQSRAPQLAPVWDDSADEFDMDGSAELQELDLTNHPSYQERNRGGDRDNRRRRRNRLRIGDPANAKGGSSRPDLDNEFDSDAGEEAPVKDVTTTPIVREGRESREGREPREAREGRDGRETRDGREPREAREGRDGREAREGREPREAREGRDGRETREGRPDKPERGSRREKTPAEPPQVIVVEMTPEEQEIYALMGISPLMLSPETVKDSRSVVVSVALPGEGHTLRRTIAPPNGSVVVAEPAAATLPEAAPLPTVEPSLPKRTLDPIKERSPVVTVPEVDQTTASPPEVAAITEAAEDTEEAEASNRRRRRRRSSVSSSESAGNAD